uniref:Uncharacterized protein n=1 Tax=Anguilla anguilla TaxID=7936 RepID=A0A0E9SEA2_ANGAN
MCITAMLVQNHITFPIHDRAFLFCFKVLFQYSCLKSFRIILFF